jgi:hypothetical protein
MTPATHLPPLPEKKRRFIFLSMVLAFAIAVPVLVFYAIGYRFDFTEDLLNFKAVGGMYIISDAEDVLIAVDGEQVENMRFFRSAAYIQNLEAGVHEVYVERPDLHTWVKDLPVFAHIVTEAKSFNMPIRPQVRLLTEWNDDLGNDILFEEATSTHFGFASTTGPLRVATSTATTTLTENLEYAYIESRFASSSEELSILRAYEKFEAQRFNFAAEKALIPTTTATTTKYSRDSVLYKREGEVYVTWAGDREDIPYYFCVTNKGPTRTPLLYGEHVYEQIVAQTPTSTDLTKLSLYDETLCRNSIRIDRLWQNVHWFDFLPDNSDLVLMHLDDGLYVVEVDDRAWQNTQLLYPGTDLEVILDGGRIFVRDRGYYLEVFTQIAE